MSLLLLWALASLMTFLVVIQAFRVVDHHPPEKFDAGEWIEVISISLCPILGIIAALCIFIAPFCKHLVKERSFKK